MESEMIGINCNKICIELLDDQDNNCIRIKVCNTRPAFEITFAHKVLGGGGEGSEGLIINKCGAICQIKNVILCNHRIGEGQ